MAGRGGGGIRWEGGKVGYGGKGARWDTVGRGEVGYGGKGARRDTVGRGEVGPTTNQIKNYFLQVCNNACHATESKV